MTVLRYSPDLALPLDAVTQRAAFLGRIGSGKSYAATKLAELMLDAGAQVVALDPVGVWYGLRVAGKGAGYAVPVFGGLHGDVPLEPGAGAMMADLIVDRALSCVLDVSQFATDKDKARFAADFADRFFWRKKAAPAAVHVFLEECQEFVPQNPQRGEELMLHHWTRMAKLGRNFGIGLSLISQRPQEVNKKVLNLTEVLLAFQMTGAHERKAIKEWIASVGADENILKVLPSLPVGVAHVYSPQWLRISKQVRAAEKRSADVSSTPLVGASPVVSKPLTKVDLATLRDVMATTIEKAKADDPKELRKTIARLERELAGKPAAAPDPRDTARAVAAAVRPYQLQIARLGMKLLPLVKALGDVTTKVEAVVTEAQVQVSEAETGGPAARPDAGVRRDVAAAGGEPVARRPIAPPRATDGAAPIGKGERAILTAIAQHEDGVDREQLSVLTGYKRSSRDTYLQRLTAGGLAALDGSRIVATDAGIAALGDDFEPLPTGAALRAYWLDRLTGGERTILEVVCGVYPKVMPRETISDRTEYKRSSRDTYLQRLSARKLITSERDGVRASDLLFEGGR